MEVVEKECHLAIPEIEKILDKNLKDLSDLLGDFLILLELQIYRASDKTERLSKAEIQKIIEECAEKADYLLSQHKKNMTNDLEEFMESLYVLIKDPTKLS